MTGSSVSGLVTYPAAVGFRLRDPTADPGAGSPVHTGTITAVITDLESGLEIVRSAVVNADGGFALPFDAQPARRYQVELTAEDRWGNRGQRALDSARE